MRQHADERHPGAVEPRRGGGDLGRLNQPQQPLLGARAAGGAEGDEGKTAGSGGLHGEEDLLAGDRTDAGAEEGVIEDDDHRLATPDSRRAGEHRLADATAGTAEPLRRLSETIGYRQQVAEDERVERDEGGVRLRKLSSSTSSRSRSRAGMGKWRWQPGQTRKVSKALVPVSSTPHEGQANGSSLKLASRSDVVLASATCSARASAAICGSRGPGS